ncbi:MULTISPECIES: lipocalin family protein [unclassified Xanthomonas]|uniref:lipocalin family protein n=1 Tax=unclassified Xanthomonas TaxID=2643310 RepID=UPI001611B0F9|nr:MULTISPECIES: lipocalin family protein [unclassified Xanthomonas]MBB4131922.1 apolipoprotein D and lipocalin family protein [Xanthomonas sp. 3075]MBB5864880.1 apolipoprotein D and lipocalin family protein [Xanthomonas sp. 3058]
MSLPRLLLSFVVLLPLAAFAQQPVRAVPHLDISRYAGQWHEIAHLPVSFQKKCRSDITARYTLRDDGLIGVHNGCRTTKGALTQADGVARPVDGHPGQLQVRFAPDWLSWLPLVWADYWVIALDPDYQWAVVGEPDRQYLWILSRSPQMQRAQFEQLKAKATQMGYDLSPLIVAAPLL